MAGGWVKLPPIMIIFIMHTILSWQYLCPEPNSMYVPKQNIVSSHSISELCKELGEEIDILYIYI